MTGINDVINTANGSIGDSGTEDYIHSIDGEETAPTGYKIFKLVNSNRSGGVYIPNIDDVVNPATKRVERIRLLNGVDTIWLKEQKDITPEYVRNNSVSLVFPRGQKVMIIHDWETTKLEFAKICRHNIGSPNRKTGSKFEFYEYDPQKQAEEALNRELLEMDMVVKASQLDIAKVKEIASFLGVRFVDDLGQPKRDELIRKELMVAAKRDPKRFEACLDSKEVSIQFSIKKAILDAKIDLGGTDRKVKWANGGSICTIPQSRKPLEYLTELAMTNDKEGKAFLAQLKAVSK